MPSSSMEIALVLRHLAESLETGHSATVRLADETIYRNTGINENRCGFVEGTDSSREFVAVHFRHPVIDNDKVKAD